MNKLLIAIILGILPAISFFLQYYSSKKYGKLKQFKRHFQCCCLDWLLVPFGIIWIYIINISLNMFLFLLGISLILNSITHIYWKYAIIRNKENCHMFDLKTNAANLSALVHFLFSTIEFALFLGFLFFAPNNLLTLLAGTLMILFLLGGFISSKKIHGKIILSDLILILLGILIVLGKLILF